MPTNLDFIRNPQMRQGLEGIFGHAAFDNVGTVYYVDVNAGVDTNDGLSWGTAFKKLSPAIIASNVAIAAGAAGWANRNTIYFKGDNNEAAKETLITLPNKCDVIGVGSYDHRPFPLLIGNHVIGAGNYMGTRFINMGFRKLAAGGAIFTVPGTTAGLEFIECYFDGSDAVVATYGLVATAVERLNIDHCQFAGAFSVAPISIGAGESNGLRINKNLIQSGAAGILINAGMTCSVRAGYITENVFDVQTLTVNDVAGKTIIANNTGRTAAAKEVATVLVAGTGMAANNTFGNATGWGVYPAVAAIT